MDDGVEGGVEEGYSACVNLDYDEMLKMGICCRECRRTVGGDSAENRGNKFYKLDDEEWRVL